MVFECAGSAAATSREARETKRADRGEARAGNGGWRRARKAEVDVVETEVVAGRRGLIVAKPDLVGAGPSDRRRDRCGDGALGTAR